MLGPALITVELVYALPEAVKKMNLTLPLGHSIHDALKASKFDIPADASFGVFSQQKDLSHILADGDRLEIYRPLLHDPKLKRMIKVDKTNLPRRCR